MWMWHHTCCKTVKNTLSQSAKITLARSLLPYALNSFNNKWMLRYFAENFIDTFHILKLFRLLVVRIFHWINERCDQKWRTILEMKTINIKLKIKVKFYYVLFSHSVGLIVFDNSMRCCCCSGRFQQYFQYPFGLCQ